MRERDSHSYTCVCACARIITLHMSCKYIYCVILKFSDNSKALKMFSVPLISFLMQCNRYLFLFFFFLPLLLFNRIQYHWDGEREGKSAQHLRIKLCGCRSTLSSHLYCFIDMVNIMHQKWKLGCFRFYCQILTDNYLSAGLRVTWSRQTAWTIKRSRNLEERVYIYRGKEEEERKHRSNKSNFRRNRTQCTKSES